MTHQELAQMIDGREHLAEISKEEAQQAKDAGLVVVFGASDDLAELRGAIYDGLYMYEGGTFLVNNEGLSENKCDCDDCPNFNHTGQSITAHWDSEDEEANGFTWAFSTEIPHSIFRIYEPDGDHKYCQGIVFALADIEDQTREQA